MPESQENSMPISGKQFINGERMASAYASFSSYDAVTGKALPYAFLLATDAEIDLAATAAAAAYQSLRTTGLDERANFLETIADEIDNLDDQFIQLVMLETGLPEARVSGERARTTNQLRLFASVVRRGDFLGARITTALPDLKPSPRPDIRQ